MSFSDVSAQETAKTKDSKQNMPTKAINICYNSDRAKGLVITNPILSRKRKVSISACGPSAFLMFPASEMENTSTASMTM